MTIVRHSVEKSIESLNFAKLAGLKGYERNLLQDIGQADRELWQLIRGEESNQRDIL
jgi:hypothetical protein